MFSSAERQAVTLTDIRKCDVFIPADLPESGRGHGGGCGDTRYNTSLECGRFFGALHSMGSSLALTFLLGRI